MIYSLILFLLTLCNASLLRELNTNIIINDISIDSCKSNSVTVKLTASSLPKDFTLESDEGYLESSSGEFIKLTPCKANVAANLITCEDVTLAANKQYSFKNYTSKGYQYISNVPSTSIIQLSVNYASVTNPISISIIKGQPFTISVDNSVKEAGLFIKVADGNYTPLSCSFKEPLSFICTVTSTLDLSLKQSFEIYQRTSCGAINTVDNLGSLSIEPFSFTGNKYINIDIVQDYYYSIQLSTKYSDYSKIFLKGDNNINIPFDCSLLNNDYYNCTIRKEHIKTENKGILSLFYEEDSKSTKLIADAVELFETEEVTVELNYSTLTLGEKNQITITFSEIQNDDDINNYKDIRMISNSLTTQDNGCQTEGISITDNKLSIICEFTYTDNCTVSYYYINRTNALNKIGEDLVIGYGIPNYESSSIIKSNILFFFVSFLLII